jgi:glycolate oxidase FAD binding subunit
VGGIVAANLNGPRRTSDGNVRDLAIGMKVALATGEIVKAGGKVVKNVAGYDMCKLFTGSLGTLGIITELTLRVAPLPEAERSACATGTLEQSLRLAGELAAAKLLPTSVLSSSRADETHWQVTTRFEGFNQAVERQLGDFAAIAERAGMTAKIPLATEGKEIWRAITRLPLTPQRLVQRLTLPRAALSTVLRDLASGRDSDSELAADLLAGVIWLVAPPSAESSKQFNTLIDLAQRHRGHAVIFNAPAESKAGLDVWGPAAPSLFLMRRIKQHFDPAGRLNPGRFVDFI